MILPTAATHGIFVDRSQPRRGFSSVENSRVRSGDEFNKMARERGDAAHPLQEIQNDAFAGKNDPGVVADHRDRLPRPQAYAVKDLGMRGDFVVCCDRAVERGINVENARHTANPGQDAVLLGNDRRRGALVRVHAGIAGGVARRPVFQQRVLQNRGKSSAIPIHIVETLLATSLSPSSEMLPAET